MDDISALIREAKPLYQARKRRNRIIRTSLAFAAVLWIGTLAYKPMGSQNYDYYWDSGYFTTENVPSVIEDMGLPTDEYGLLMIG